MPQESELGLMRPLYKTVQAAHLFNESYLEGPVDFPHGGSSFTDDFYPVVSPDQLPPSYPRLSGHLDMVRLSSTELHFRLEDFYLANEAGTKIRNVGSVGLPRLRQPDIEEDIPLFPDPPHARELAVDVNFAIPAIAIVAGRYTLTYANMRRSFPQSERGWQQQDLREHVVATNIALGMVRGARKLIERRDKQS